MRGIHEHLLGVPIQEELTALRFWVDVGVSPSGPRGLQEAQGARDQSVRTSLIDTLLHDLEYSEEEVAETMAETMEQYMRKTRADYGSGVARPKIEDKDNFELKG
ncbi:hypothetical protein Tco_0365284 [Tanacetum coccineum]